ncbi:hypothetical protein MAPG_03193 [Magnaporthiopsis poae ATCC 64411]|uniref:Uncharacterized protein n=1 Tax=Magnaporthiopsis poae (strain ATCC 64411 / 73-15) TaxID=644358 RepID=A0A0C4DTC9_MAGP6|nr:hypothetical protein MAPG_03193 [Magnaporthiopsis poae ATCC 64411]
MDQRQFRGGPPGATTTMASEGQPINGASDRNSTAESPSRRRQEEWVEIASQPSSSSLSSIGGDEIITTGLRVHGSSYPPRRRPAGRQAPHHQHAMPQSYVISHAAARGGTSSQDDYDETESEEDSAPVARRPAGPAAHSAHPHPGSRQNTTARHELSGYDDDDDDSGDENATALGLPSGAPHVFRPQPNAFSHPPSHLTHRHSTPGAYMGGTSAGPHASASGPRSRRASYSRAGSSRNAPQFMSPAYREDNDAALRASLTTLLSCAAAARGLPNRRREGPDTLGAGPTSNTAAMQPMDIRLVPEAELMTEAPAPAPAPSQSSADARAKLKSSSAAAPVPSAATAADKKASAGGLARSPSSTSSATRGEKIKRAAASSPASTGQKTSGRAIKKKRMEVSASTAPETLVSPTLLTWVVSAGVVVLVSVVGFGAGYVIGREVGRQEGAGFIPSNGGVPPTNATGSCSQDMISQSAGGGALRRFRWGSMGRSIVA